MALSNRGVQRRFGLGSWDCRPLGLKSHVQELITMGQIEKSSIIAEFRLNEKDTGSCEVQIALLSTRIQQLTNHLKEHRKDFHSRRGLIAMANRRRRLLAYVRKKDESKYGELVRALGLRK
jgi:small subunit ribosomal protein S15